MILGVYRSGVAFAVEHFHFPCPFFAGSPVEPFLLHRFAVYLKAIAIDVLAIGEGGLQCRRLIDCSGIQAEVLHVDGFTNLTILERVGNETLVECKGLKHIGFA